MTAPPFFPYPHASVPLLNPPCFLGGRMDLIEFLRRKLPPEDLALLAGEDLTSGEDEYERVIRRVAARLKDVEALHNVFRSRLENQYEDLLELPSGRRMTILRNSSPVLLLILFRHALMKSYEARFGDLRASLRLAELALEFAEAVVGAKYLSAVDSEDLLAEAHAYLGNARRINSDLGGSGRSLTSASAHLSEGTGDRALKADVIKFEALLQADRGACERAAELFDAEIALRRLLGDRAKLGAALIDRGWIACWLEPVDRACDLFQAGLSLVDDDPRMTLVALLALAEAFARSGKGLEAWDTICQARVPMAKVKGERFEIHDRWIRGLACRALRESERSERYLRSVRKDLEGREEWFLLGLVSLDFAATCATEGKSEEVKRLAEEAYAIFRSEGLNERAMAAVIVLREAIDAQELTEGLAVAVANFIARYQHNTALRFEWTE